MNLQVLYETWFDLGSEASRIEVFDKMVELHDDAFRFSSSIINRKENNLELRRDAIQTTYMSVFKRVYNRNCYIKSLRGYFFISLRNNCYKELKRVGVSREVSIENFKEEIVGVQGNVESDLFDKITISEIKSNIIKIHQRINIDIEAFNLKVFNDLKESEISKVLGIPLGTVKSRIHRVRTELRATYKINIKTNLDGNDNK